MRHLRAHSFVGLILVSRLWYVSSKSKFNVLLILWCNKNYSGMSHVYIRILCNWNIICHFTDATITTGHVEFNTNIWNSKLLSNLETFSNYIRILYTHRFGNTKIIVRKSFFWKFFVYNCQFIRKKQLNVVLFQILLRCINILNVKHRSNDNENFIVWATLLLFPASMFNKFAYKNQI